MADLKRSDVSDKIGEPSEFGTITMDFDGLDERSIDVHKDDSIEDIKDEFEDYLEVWEGFFTEITL